MPGESPGRDWDALLTPPYSLDEVLAAAKARHHRRRKQRIWKVFTLVVIGIVFVAWCVLCWNAISLPGIVLAVAFFSLPLMLFATGVFLRWLENIFFPSTERELALEE